MKLYYAPLSPFARKVRACAVTREIDNQITLIEVSPYQAPPELLAGNPLSKVPCLVTADGIGLYDSPVICEYLDSITDGVTTLFPPQGGARWRALKQQALADGMMEAAILRRMEGARAQDPERTAVMERQAAAVARGLAELERDLPHKAVDIGTISIACALGYLDIRFAHEPWRPAHPRLAAWFEAFAQNPGISRTAPQA